MPDKSITAAGTEKKHGPEVIIGLGMWMSRGVNGDAKMLVGITNNQNSEGEIAMVKLTTRNRWNVALQG